MTRRTVQLFFLSFLALYAELVCIRWIPAYVRFVAYFTNFILLASFLGLGAGILSARRRLQLAPGLRVFPWLLLAIVVLVSATKFELRIQSAGVLYYGASEEGAPMRESALVLPAAFLLVALLFACIGRPLGALLAEVTPPLRAYAVDISGSLAGTVAFFLLSLTEQPPVVWFGGLLVLVLVLIRPNVRNLALAIPPLAASIFIANLLGASFWWSPYYKIGLTPIGDLPGGLVLTVNNVGHQTMVPVDAREPFYRVPYELFGQNAFQKALIIGAGSGSDSAVALRYGAGHVDAVEIDPVIARLGQRFHPDQPYADPRVTLHIDDGRSYLRKTDQRFDLIIFALPDSLTLTSQFASLRLESFLFTREAFMEARDHLADDGVLVLYNYYRETWLLRKLAAMQEAAFGRPPYVVSYGGWGRAAVLMNGPRLASVLAGQPDLLPEYSEGEAQSRQLEDDPDAVMLPVIGSGLLSTTTSIAGTDPADAAPPSLATDDWPLMYLPRPGIPGVYLAGLAMVAGCAVLLVGLLGGRETVRGFSGHMFFLGAAFMLLETRSLVSFALLFGSTWLVNTLVFFAILCSVLLAVLVSAKLTLRPSVALFALLIGALLLAYLLPASALLSIRIVPVRYALASLIAFLPIFLANLVFAGSFRLTGRAADQAFASNLLGAMVGGMLEYTALAFGYRHLLLFAITFYIGAALLMRLPAGVAALKEIPRHSGRARASRAETAGAVPE